MVQSYVQHLKTNHKPRKNAAAGKHPPRPLKTLMPSPGSSRGDRLLLWSLTSPPSLRILAPDSFDVFLILSNPCYLGFDGLWLCESENNVDGDYFKGYLPRQGQRLQNAEDECKPFVMPLKEKGSSSVNGMSASTKKGKENENTHLPKRQNTR